MLIQYQMMFCTVAQYDTIFRSKQYYNLHQVDFQRNDCWKELDSDERICDPPEVRILPGIFTNINLPRLFSNQSFTVLIALIKVA